MLNRRGFFGSAFGLAAGLTLPRAAQGAVLSNVEKASMRGAIDATDLGVRPGALDDQSKAFDPKGAERALQSYLYSGVTAVRSAGDSLGLHRP